jgi:hypothetical protein
MNAEGTFEAFCAAHALHQRRYGVEVPSKASLSFAYFQWLEVAKQQFQAGGVEGQRDGEPELRRAKIENNTAEDTTVHGGTGGVLTKALAQQLTSSLAKQARPSGAPASLRHAAQEPFPMPSPAGDLPAFLTLAEAAVRLTLWHPDNAQLSQLAARMRPNLRSLEERGLIRMQKGCFPGLQMLMDLLSWRIIAHRWARLTPEMRQMAVAGVQTLCTFLRCTATEKLQTLVQEMDVTASAISYSTAQLDRLLAEVSAAVPFEFAACRDLADLYPEPAGVLSPPKSGQPALALASASAPAVPAQPAAQDEHDVSSSAKSEEVEGDDDGSDEVRVGDLLGASAPTLAVTAASTAPARSTKEASAQSYVAHPVLDVVPHMSSSNAAVTSASTARRMATNTVNGHPACASQYHARYADATKHASAECQYCATCHMMEIVFRGDKRDCTWRHWPTERKIHYHLKRFPSVLKLALKRFSAMERGEQLATTDEVPV